MEAIRLIGHNVVAQSIGRRVRTLGYPDATAADVRAALFGLERAGFITGWAHSHCPRRYSLA